LTSGTLQTDFADIWTANAFIKDENYIDHCM